MEKRILSLLLLVASISLTVAIVASLGWYRSTNRWPTFDRLSDEVRQRLIEEALERMPGIFQTSWFEPRIGFTLRPSSNIKAWGDEFRSNDLGFRAPPSSKEEGVFRVLFVGDSWTYGMGIRQQEAFPAQFASVANRMGVEGGRVEAWPLALPGFNSLNESSALWFFFDRLKPDAVVFCLTSNDNHSTPVVLPNGSLSNRDPRTDEFGDPHVVFYRGGPFNSYRYRARWNQSMQVLHESEQQLLGLGIPVAFYFVARWEPAIVHDLVIRGRLASPYMIVPSEYTEGRWTIAALGHGNSEANELYAQWLYRGLAEAWKWPRLPVSELDEPTPPRLHGAPPLGVDWQQQADRLADLETARTVRSTFMPNSEEESLKQSAGVIDPDNGEIGRATTLLVRRLRGATRLVLTVAPVDSQGLYPLRLTATIPFSSGSSSAEILVPGIDSGSLSVEIPIPDQIPEGVAMDLQLVADRMIASRDGLRGRSLRVVSVTQQ